MRSAPAPPATRSSELRRTAGRADSLDEQTRTAFDQAERRARPARPAARRRHRRPGGRRGRDRRLHRGRRHPRRSSTGRCPGRPPTRASPGWPPVSTRCRWSARRTPTSRPSSPPGIAAGRTRRPVDRPGPQRHAAPLDRRRRLPLRGRHRRRRARRRRRRRRTSTTATCWPRWCSAAAPRGSRCRSRAPTGSARRRRSRTGTPRCPSSCAASSRSRAGRPAAGGPQRRRHRVGDPPARAAGGRGGGLLRHPLAAAPAAPAAPHRARRRRAAPARRPSAACARARRRTPRSSRRRSPPARRSARSPARSTRCTSRRSGSPPSRRLCGGVQLDLRQPVAALAGARRAPAAPHRAARELRGGPGGALQPLPARPPRDADAPQLARTCWCSRAPTCRGGAAARCRWSTCCAPRPPRWSSTSASTSRRRPRPQLLGPHGQRRRAPRRRAAGERDDVLRAGHPRAGAWRRRTGTARCSSRSSTPVSA